MKSFLLHSRILSLDIVAGALAVAFFFSELLCITMPVSYWPALAVSVWLIYLTDHLADSLFIHSRGESLVTTFFEKYRKALFILAGIMLLLLTVILFQAPVSLIGFGLAGGAIAGFYLIINQVQNWKGIFLLPREIVIACIYVYGTCGYPVFLSGSISPDIALIITGIFMLTLTNVLIYAVFDFTIDIRQGVKSLAVMLSEKTTYRIACITAAIAGLIFALSLIRGPSPKIYAAVGLLMTLFLSHILVFRKFYKRNQWYGILADLAFLFPWLLIFAK